MASTELIYINFTGGIVSTGYLKELLEIAAEAKVKNVRFGLRQQLILDVPVKQLTVFTNAFSRKNIEFSTQKDGRPNITSSYSAAGVFATDSWLREGVYKDIFNSFDYTPSIKINITDSNQSFVPFFTGHLNWVSSPSAHFWYLYVRFPKTESVYCFPELVYTNDLAQVSKHLEEVLVANKRLNSNDLFRQVKSAVQFISKPMEQELKIPKFSLPYYEGFNRHNNNYWLGIYRREETFPVKFLLDICAICMKTKIGEIYTTPWKSIMIKGIEAADRNLLDYALGKYRINVRHAANELNWQVEDNCEDGLKIKRHVIRYFDKEDVRTFGLSFAVKTKFFSSMFGSIIIRKQEVRNPDKLKALERFEILYAADFNPNLSTLIIFRKDVEKEHLGTYLISLCKYFYQLESQEKSSLLESEELTSNDLPGNTSAIIYHQCKHCFTVYDEALGNPENNISAGTAFNDLHENYQCPLCEAKKKDFKPVDEVCLKLQ